MQSYQYINIFISDHIFNMIGLNHREMATLPATMYQAIYTKY